MKIKRDNQDITISINGRKVSARRREPLLDVAIRSGIDIPHLCHHPALEAAGACRLCLVEVVRENRRKTVTSCTYPAEEGLEVVTDTPELAKHRAMVLELLLARTPKAPAIVRLAADHGVEAPRFPAGDDTCIMCGLCTRVCEAYATSTITAVNRGEKKAIGTYLDEPPDDCVACGACADICPTGHIEVTKSAGKYAIWGREKALATCSVVGDRCRGCGACEEACPFLVPRVKLGRDGSKVAFISTESCRGCGVCLAACPSGAIVSPRAHRDIPRIEGTGGRRSLVVACGRSNLHRSVLPEGATWLEPPCAGGVSPSLMLGALARGYDGVLVLGRHQETCRLNGAEDHGRLVVDRAEQLARLAGLGTGRIAFREPKAGPEGPRDAAQRFLERCSPSPVAAPIDMEEIPDTAEGTMEVLRWLSGREELAPGGEEWLTEHGLPAAKPGKPVLAASSVPYLDLLFAEWLGEGALTPILTHGLDVLRQFGIQAGVAVGRFEAGEELHAERFPGSEFYCLSDDAAERLKRAGASAVSLNTLLSTRGSEISSAIAYRAAACDEENEALVRLIESIGWDLVPIKALPVFGSRLAISQEERMAVEERLFEAQQRGACCLLVEDPWELAGVSLIQRAGAWRAAKIPPTLAADLVARGAQKRRAFQ